MSETIRFDQGLEMFQDIVTLYRDTEGKLFIGNTYFYDRKGNDADWMSVMYSDALPEDMDIMLGWNWLDENSPNIILVPEATPETGVEDFLYAHGHERDWKSIDYNVIRSYPEIEAWFKKNELAKGDAVSFGIRK